MLEHKTQQMKERKHTLPRANSAGHMSKEVEEQQETTKTSEADVGRKGNSSKETNSVLKNELYRLVC